MSGTTLRATAEAAETLRQLALLLSVQLGRRISLTETVSAAAQLAAGRPEDMAELLRTGGTR